MPKPFVALRVTGRRDRKGREYRFLDRLSEAEKARLKQRVPLLVAQPAFELNLASLYLSRCLGASRAQLEKLVRDNATKPDADPVRNALSYLESNQVATKTPALSFAHEPDDIQPDYWLGGFLEKSRMVLRWGAGEIPSLRPRSVLIYKRRR
jgi:hypothetical protein